MFKVKPLSKVVLAMLSIVCTMPVLAKEGDTFRPYVSVSIIQDDNLLRYDDRLVLPDSVRLADTVVQTAIGIDVDWEVSRQRLTLNASLNENKYANNKRLDNQGESIKAGWNWRIGSRFNGRLGYAHDKALASFTDNQVVALSGANRVTEGYFASGFWLLAPDWRAGVSLSKLEREYDNAASKISNADTNSTEVSLFYLGFASNRVGIKLRQNNTKYPERTFNSLSNVDNQYQLTTALVVLNWQLAGKSILQGQLGLETLTNEHLGDRDYSDVTAKITYQLNSTGKFQFRASIWSEIDSSWISDAAYQRTQAFELQPLWKMSLKNSLMLNYTFENIAYDGSNAVDDRTRLSLYWVNEPVRNVAIVAGYTDNQRDSSRQFRNYQSSLYSLKLKVTW